MRRADRLFRIVEYLKARSTAVTAAALAAELGVSVRTVYRDIADLGGSGVPIVGEAGVGYLLDRAFVVRPLTFTLEELDALALGAQMVASWGDRELAHAANKARDRIAASLPADLRREIMETALFAPDSASKLPTSIDTTALRRAIRSRNFVRFAYRKPDGTASSRRLRPLCLLFFGPAWLLMGWCENRRDFRNFRLDRMTDLVVEPERFEDEDGKRLSDYPEAARIPR